MAVDINGNILDASGKPTGQSINPVTGAMVNAPVGTYMTNGVADVRLPKDTPSPVIAGAVASGNLRQSPADYALAREKADADIAAKAATQRQAVIDAINTQFGAKSARVQELGNQALASQRSINLRAGLGGSDFGAQAKGEVRAKTTQELNAVDAERVQAIQTAVTGIEDLTLKRQQAARENRLEDETYKQNYKTDALNVIKNLGAGRVTIDKLKSPENADAYKSLIEAGYGDLEIGSLLEQNIPDAYKPKYQEFWSSDAQGNAVLHRTGFDPVTGKALPPQTYKMDVPYSVVNTEKPVPTGDGRFLVPDPTIPGGYKMIGEVKAEDPSVVKLRAAQTEQALANAEESRAKARGVGEGAGGVYVAGADPVVDSYIRRIQNGEKQESILKGSDPATRALRNKISLGLVAQGNDLTGKPTITQLGKTTLKSAEDLLAKFNAGTGTGAVGKSRFFGGGLIDMVPGTDRANFIQRFKNVSGLAQLDMAKVVQGQGQVSDNEREIIRSAATNLALSQTEEEFKETLELIIDKLKGLPDGTTAAANPPPTSGVAPISAPDGTQVEIID